MADSSSPRQRVLIVSSEFPPQPGGIGNHAWNLANALVEKGSAEVRVLTEGRLNGGKQEEAFDTAANFPVLRVAWAARGNRQWKRIVALRQQVREWHPDIVIASGRFPLWLCAWLPTALSFKKVAVIHGTEAGAPGSWVRRLTLRALGKYEKVIAVSQFTRSYFELSADDPRVFVIPNGVPDQRLNKNVVNVASLDGEPALITVGNVTRRKGQDNVIRALPSLLEKYPNLHYHLVGLPTEQDKFTSLANDLRVASKITFHGAVSDQRLDELLAGADLFLMLSSQTADGDVEGFGIALLEANAFGVPGVGAKGCGIEDAIDDQRSGLLVDARDAVAVTNAVDKIIANRPRYSEQAKCWAASHSWTEIVGRYIAAIWDRERVSA